MQKSFSFMLGYMRYASNMPANSKSVIDERRQKLFALLTRGMKGYEIAKELRVDSATVSRYQISNCTVAELSE
jgi:DNA-binding NarL/FixJ family response regulator